MHIDITYAEKKEILEDVFNMNNEERIKDVIEHTADSEFYDLYFDFIPVK